MSQQPLGPGWWRAPDGRWYPTQPYQPPPPARSRRGCVIAAVVVTVVLLAGVGVAIWAVARLATSVVDVATGGGQIACPAEAEVSEIVGSRLTLAGSASVVVASGCSYTATDRQRGVDVQITAGAALIADEEFRSFEGDAANVGGTVVPVGLGSRSAAFGGERRSGAIAVDGSRLVVVEVFSADAPIGDKQAAAVRLLQRVLAGA